jgi:hypothetical protein
MDRSLQSLLLRKRNDIFDIIISNCCKYCNFAKSNNSLEEFLNWIDRLKQFNG